MVRHSKKKELSGQSVARPQCCAVHWKEGHSCPVAHRRTSKACKCQGTSKEGNRSPVGPRKDLQGLQGPGDVAAFTFYSATRDRPTPHQRTHLSFLNSTDPRDFGSHVVHGCLVLMQKVHVAYKVLSCVFSGLTSPIVHHPLYIILCTKRSSICANNGSQSLHGVFVSSLLASYRPWHTEFNVVRHESSTQRGL